MNISFITAFRKFKGNHNMIQQSAMYSWKANDIKVYAPTNEVGVKEKCADWDNMVMIDDVKRARELGFSNQSPIVRDLIAKALPLINTPMVALINSDIIIESDFSEKIQKIFDKYGYDIYMIATRKDVKLEITIYNEDTYNQVLNQDRLDYDNSTSSDIFITSKFLWRKIIHEMPEFILGRYAWDNWLHYYAEINKLKRYNCSEVLPILHCQHDHHHIRLQEKVTNAKEAASSQHNVILWQKVLDVYGTTRVNYWPKVEL